MNIDAAPRRIRFLNFLIDFIVFSVLGTFFLVFLKKYTNLFQGETGIYDRLFSLFMYFVYYLLFEFFTHTTPGKLVTRTKVVAEDFSFGSILARSALRLIPLEPLTIFFNEEKLCWHDQFSKTKTICLTKNKER